jgi:hypothetical protein
MEIVMQPKGDLRRYPEGSGIAITGALMMVAGAYGPWIGDKLFGTRAGLHLGGDGWLVVLAAVLAVVPLFFLLPRGRARGFWVIGWALAGGFVCLTHYQEAGADGIRVAWGLQLASAGVIVASIGGARLLVLRAR